MTYLFKHHILFRILLFTIAYFNDFVDRKKLKIDIATSLIN